MSLFGTHETVIYENEENNGEKILNIRALDWACLEQWK